MSPSDVSVVIPTRNEASTIATAVRSASAAGAAEIIVVDGGSEDATIEVAQQAGASLIVSCPPGRGIQLSRGATAASGRIVLFLHADNRLGSDLLEPDLRPRERHLGCIPTTHRFAPPHLPPAGNGQRGAGQISSAAVRRPSNVCQPSGAGRTGRRRGNSADGRRRFVAPAAAVIASCAAGRTGHGRPPTLANSGHRAANAAKLGHSIGICGRHFTGSLEQVVSLILDSQLWWDCVAPSLLLQCLIANERPGIFR